MNESQYQLKLIKKITHMFPGCLVLKNNPAHLQGVPDLLILYSGTWGALEVKLALDSEIQANQSYYVAMMDRMSFAAFIYPENEEMVLNELQLALTSGRTSRIPQSQ
jgi:hypothetical protein